MATTTKKKRIKFQIEADPGSKVFVAGTFNNWKDNDKQLTSDNDGNHYSKNVLVPKGTHEYKYIVNGEWQTDGEADSISNGLGSFNHVMRVD